MTRISATIEARVTSTRLPGKVLKEAAGKPMLGLMIERLKRVPSLDSIIVATTTNTDDDPVAQLAARLGVGCYRGSEDDVLSRVLEAAQAHNVDVIVETTGDCPLVDPETVERVIGTYLANGFDYVSNTLAPRTYPIGMDTQVFATSVLADVARRTGDPNDREHVSIYIYQHPELYSLHGIEAPPDLAAPDVSVTLDTADDLKLIRAVFERLCPENPAFGLRDILRLLREDPEIAELCQRARQTKF